MYRGVGASTHAVDDSITVIRMSCDGVKTGPHPRSLNLGVSLSVAQRTGVSRPHCTTVLENAFSTPSNIVADALACKHIDGAVGAHTYQA